MVKIRFPSALQAITKTNEKELNLKETSIRSVFEELTKEYGSEFERIIFDDGDIRRFINVFVNGENIRHLSGLETEIKDGDEISILPAVSGG